MRVHIYSCIPDSLLHYRPRRGLLNAFCLRICRFFAKSPLQHHFECDDRSKRYQFGDGFTSPPHPY